jgi:hypothetical protein
MRTGVPQETGGYELLGPLGSGGMGTVYRARDAEGRIVALKLLHSHLGANPEARERLTREVASLQRVRHPAVARVLDAEIDSAEAFVVTELVKGSDLATYVAAHGPLGVGELAELAERLRAALSTVHSAGVLHRDLSPGNVMITESGPMLIDFGIALAVEDQRATARGPVTGTPGYVAPELLEGGQPSVAGDWWGWAAVLVFAATGRPPFGKGPVIAILARARSGNLDLAGVDRRVAGVLRSALAVDPWRRSAPETVVEELVRAAGKSSGPETGRTPAAEGRWRARLRSGHRHPEDDVGEPLEDEGWSLDGEDVPALEDYKQHVGRRVDSGPLPPRRRGTVLAFALLTVALSLAWPVVALAAGLLLVVLVRSVGLDAEAVHRRWIRRGERRGADVLRAVAGWPWYLVRAVVGAFPSLVVAALAVAGTWSLAWWSLDSHRLLVAPDGAEEVLVGNAGLVGRAVLALVVVVWLVVAWFGPLARSTRTGARWTFSGLGPGVAGAAALILLVLVVTAIVVAMTVTHDVVWWPLPGPPEVG